MHIIELQIKDFTFYSFYKIARDNKHWNFVCLILHRDKFKIIPRRNAALCVCAVVYGRVSFKTDWAIKLAGLVNVDKNPFLFFLGVSLGNRKLRENQWRRC